jgi:hypothetical protein
MARWNQLASIGAATLALAIVTTAGVAAPLSLGADAIIGSTAVLNLVEPTHGTHRACLLGRVSRWGGIVRLHRHVGSAHTPVRC